MTPFPPIDSEMLSAILATYSKVSLIATEVIGAIFIARTTLLLLTVSSPNSYFELFKETVLLLLALNLSPFVLKTVLSSSSEIAGLIRFEPQERIEGPVDGLLASLAENLSFLGVAIDIGDLTVKHLVRAVFSLLIGLLSVAAPLIFISGYVFGQGIGVPALGGSLLALSLWPVLWNVIGLLGSTLWQSFQGTSLSSFVFSVAVLILQTLSPIFTVSLLRSSDPKAIVPSVRWLSSKMRRG
jgi:hypothetical protein